MPVLAFEHLETKLPKLLLCRKLIQQQATLNDREIFFSKTQQQPWHKGLITDLSALGSQRKGFLPPSAAAHIFNTTQIPVTQGQQVFPNLIARYQAGRAGLGPNLGTGNPSTPFFFSFNHLGWESPRGMGVCLCSQKQIYKHAKNPMHDTIRTLGNTEKGKGSIFTNNTIL